MLFCSSDVTMFNTYFLLIKSYQTRLAPFGTLIFVERPSRQQTSRQAKEREMTRQLDKFEWKKGTDAKNPEAGLKPWWFQLWPN